MESYLPNTKIKLVPIGELSSLRRLTRSRYQGDVIEAPGKENRGTFIRRHQKIVRLVFDRPVDPNDFQKLSIRVKGDLRTSGGKAQNRIIDKVRVVKVCACSSDNTIVCLLEAPELTSIDNSGALVIEPGDGNPPPRVTGSDNGILFNEAIFRRHESTVNELTPDLLAIIRQRSRLLGEVPIVAVIDTGFDYAHCDAITLAYGEGDSTCVSGTIKDDYIGWNFVDGNNNPYDDSPSKHGTQIAAIINHQTRGRVKIMPIKVFKSDGYGELFDLLCALAYIKSKPFIKIINGSFGYYAQKGNDIFHELLDEMTDKVSVFAAGNRADFINEPKPRNIGGFDSEGVTLKFFPACFSTTLSNSLTATSVADKRSAQLGQMVAVENFSTEFVTMGIRTNSRGEYSSYLPEIPSPIIGSSYATPYVTSIAVSILAEQPLLSGHQLRDAVLLPAHQNPSLEKQFVHDGLFLTI